MPIAQPSHLPCPERDSGEELSGNDCKTLAQGLEPDGISGEFCSGLEPGWSQIQFLKTVAPVNGVDKNRQIQFLKQQCQETWPCQVGPRLKMLEDPLSPLS